jgi:pyruvate dehydrogenase E1 component alpha subunit
MSALTVTPPLSRATSTDTFRRLYRQLFRIRRVEEVIAELYPQQQMRCPVHLCIGQEAIPVGVCSELWPEDYAFSTHRSHGHYLAKGGDLNAMLAELHGKETGCAGGKGGSMHLIDRRTGFLGAAPILGATIALAVGAAFGSKMRRENRVTVAFFGDGAVEEGIFYESANFAVLRRLPVVLVCENNHLSMFSPPEVRQPPERSLCELAQGIGLTAESGDGNDVLEVVRLARRAVRQARAGDGPVFLELHTYRWREHCGPNYDFDLGYRSAAEFDGWKARCPLRHLQKQMMAVGVWDSTAAMRMIDEVNAEIQTAVRFAQDSPFPPARRLLEHEYAA